MEKNTIYDYHDVILITPHYVKDQFRSSNSSTVRSPTQFINVT